MFFWTKFKQKLTLICIFTSQMRFLPRYAERGYATVCHPSVCLSVRNV